MLKIRSSEKLDEEPRQVTIEGVGSIVPNEPFFVATTEPNVFGLSPEPYAIGRHQLGLHDRP